MRRKLLRSIGYQEKVECLSQILSMWPIKVKSKNMRKRKAMKLAGYRLIYNVTKQNTGLINRLNLHKETDLAWYFNGNVFGTTKGSNGKHFKFDLFFEY